MVYYWVYHIIYHIIHTVCVYLHIRYIYSWIGLCADLNVTGPLGCVSYLHYQQFFFFFFGALCLQLIVTTNFKPTFSSASCKEGYEIDIVYIYIYIYTRLYIYIYMYMYDMPTIPTHKFDCKSTTSITWSITLLRNGSVSVGLEFSDKSR